MHSFCGDYWGSIQQGPGRKAQFLVRLDVKLMQYMLVNRKSGGYETFIVCQIASTESLGILCKE